MLLAVQLAALALGAPSCPSNLANELAAPGPAASRQVITVEAGSSRATYATARIWPRTDSCWTPAGGPYAARVGRNGVRKDKHEGDGSTPAGTYAIGRKMYGNSPNPGVSYPNVRLRCGDWWVEDSKSPIAVCPRSFFAQASFGRHNADALWPLQFFLPNQCRFIHKQSPLQRVSFYSCARMRLPKHREALVNQALQRNPELNFFVADIAAAKGALRTAGTLRNPELSTELGYKNSRENSGGANGDGAILALSFSQTFE